MSKMSMDDMSGGGSGYDIAIYPELFEMAKEAEKEFNNSFVPSYVKLLDMYNKMSKDEGFRGKACEGFIEMFDILLQYHKDLNEEIPKMYKEFDKFFNDLQEIKKSGIYQSLED